MNRLADETSPYLQQHAHNPVDWYPWGDEALNRAREQNKPIFLSIGYSACHWCHVMERESFENEEIADFLNEHFVSVKVDREERPDIDNIYMEAVQVMTGRGGWPMSVFLTPELKPFFAGTYFPPRDRWGKPGFMSLLKQLADVWSDDPKKVAEVTDQVTERLELMSRTEPGDRLDLDPLDEAFRHFRGTFDPVHAGFGSAPKFPPSMQVRLLLHVGADEERAEKERHRALDMVEQTLVHMAAGGMYDQIGGGFHRYSVDREWLVPHFEKMLYDNALLTWAYTEAFQMTGRPFYERIVTETLAYVRREMVSPGGAFYSTQDADSEGEEGKFFVWTPESVREVLSPEEATRAEQFWDITEDGNFEGSSIPNRLATAAEDWTLMFAELPDDVVEIREKLFRAREERVAPATDTKVITAWNGLMISAFARAGAVFEDQTWLDVAERAASFVLEEMQSDEEGLFRTYKDERARFRGYLDDYAFFGHGLFDLFEATSDLRWLREAKALAGQCLDHFWDAEGGAFYYTAEHHRHLIVRQKESYDSATPASNSIAASLFLRLAVATGSKEQRDVADMVLKTYYDQMKKAPRSLCELIGSLDMHLRGPEELVCVTPPGERSLAHEARRDFRPNAIVFDVPTDAADAYREAVPVARDREPVDDKPTIYVCNDGVCELPRTDLTEV